MDWRWVKGVQARRSLIGLVIVLCGGAGALAHSITRTSARASAPPSAVSTESPAAFRSALESRLTAQGLNYHYVVCVRTSHRFRGVSVVRCNVDFGIDPHVEAYCSVLRGGRLLTSAQDHAIPCGHDNAGFSDPVVQYNP